MAGRYTFGMRIYILTVERIIIRQLTRIRILINFYLIGAIEIDI